MWESALIWALTIGALCGSGIYVGNERIRELIGLKRGQMTLTEDERRSQLARDEEEERIALMERENAAKIAAENIEEYAERDRALVLQQAAEARAAAVVAESEAVIAARIAAEEQVIAAGAEGRALAEKERALHQGDSSGRNERVASVMEAYQTYRNTGGGHVLSDWLGDIELDI